MSAIMHYKNHYNFRAKFILIIIMEINNISSHKHHFCISRTEMASRGDTEPLKLQMALAKVVQAKGYILCTVEPYHTTTLSLRPLYSGLKKSLVSHFPI